MTRFRLGQRWKREPTAHPWDSIALELDGVNLLTGAVEEPLAEVVPALAVAAAALHTGRRKLAQLSLSEASLELVMRRTGADVELSVASLGRPARLLRHAIRVELEEFSLAAHECAKGFLADVSQADPRVLSPSTTKVLSSSLRLLSGPVRPVREAPPEPFTP